MIPDVEGEGEKKMMKHSLLFFVIISYTGILKIIRLIVEEREHGKQEFQCTNEKR